MPGAAPARLPPALLPSGAKVPVSGMGRRVYTYKGWNKLRPISMASAPATWDLPGPIRLEQSQGSGSLPHLLHRGDSCQHALGMDDPAHLSSSSAPKPLGTQIAQGMHPHKDIHPCKNRSEIFPHFIETEKVKQNEKTEEFVSNETIRKHLKNLLKR